MSTAVVVFLCASLTSAPTCQWLATSAAVPAPRSAEVAPSPSSATSPIETPQDDGAVTPMVVPSSLAPRAPGPPGERLERVRLGVADGALPTGVTAFDAGYPGVANLDPDLLRAVREAARDAADDGVRIYVVSGWRSPEFQERLLRLAIAEYGSLDEAARWVATPVTSTHVSGDAIDLGASDAMAWLSEHGARYGLCQIYRNEPWHYELRPEAIDRRCPEMYVDPTHDPRMLQ